MHDARRPVAVFAGGGTGGHLYPALGLAAALQAQRPDVRCHFVGAARGVEARIYPQRGVEHTLLPVRGFTRGRRLSALRALPALGRSLLRTWRLFRELRPEVVVVTGGYAGGPAGIVAALSRIPLVLQEQNAVPGVTTRGLSRWARQIHVAFPEVVDRLPAGARERVRVSGNPIRPMPALEPAEARRLFDLPEHGVVALVIGGSQGSAALNRVLSELVVAVADDPALRPPTLSVLWATGPGHHSQVVRGLEPAGSPDWLRVVPYIDDVPAALAAADLAVSRAGAMTTGELLAAGLPAILVPLPTAAEDHQARNAEALEAAGAAWAVPEGGLDGRGLLERIRTLVEDVELRGRMARAARARARPGAAEAVAGEIAGLMRGGPA